MSVVKKLCSMQVELNVPKSQRNTFGEFNYRSCEDIFEAVKPLLGKYGVVLTCGDELVMVGDRYYIKATATLTDIDDGDSVSNVAYARENESRPKMDVAQVTGTASSYARKYALNGLFVLDDNKDVDGMNNATQGVQSAPAVAKSAQHQQPQQQAAKPTQEWVKNINGATCVLANNGQYYPLEPMTAKQLTHIINDARYKKCHDEARRLAAEKGMA